MHQTVILFLLFYSIYYSNARGVHGIPKNCPFVSRHRSISLYERIVLASPQSVFHVLIDDLRMPPVEIIDVQGYVQIARVPAVRPASDRPCHLLPLAHRYRLV